MPNKPKYFWLTTGNLELFGVIKMRWRYTILGSSTNKTLILLGYLQCTMPQVASHKEMTVTKVWIVLYPINKWDVSPVYTIYDFYGILFYHVDNFNEDFFDELVYIFNNNVGISPTVGGCLQCANVVRDSMNGRMSCNLGICVQGNKYK
jgi:hypothetical protein